jgi:hypothetical protein
VSNLWIVYTLGTIVWGAMLMPFWGRPYPRRANARKKPTYGDLIDAVPLQARDNVKIRCIRTVRFKFGARQRVVRIWFKVLGHPNYRISKQLGKDLEERWNYFFLILQDCLLAGC